VVRNLEDFQTLDLHKKTVNSISVVIPVYNEGHSVEKLCKSLSNVLDSLRLKGREIIFIDDGSKDNTFEVLYGLKKYHRYLKIICLRRNFGQTAALAAGFDYASGEIIVTMDGDLQNDPQDIPRLLEKIQEGYDVVSGWRKMRKDPLLSRRIPSKLANFLISKVTGVKLRDYGCTLKAYRKEVLENVNLFGDMHRFIPALVSWMGIKMTEIEVKHHPRRGGQSKYGFSRTFRVLLDLITVKFMIGFISRPIQMLGPIGLFLLLGGFGYGLFLTFQRLLFSLYIKPLRPLICVLMIITGAQIITMGLLSEMIMRTYFELQKKPIYVIKNIVE
jgi:glycosyltransferase involved in cell wall biosynthesis